MKNGFENLIWFTCGGDEYTKMKETDKELALREQYTVHDMITLYQNIECE